MNGIALLADYRAKGTEEAFAALVRQYAGLVYSVAFRRLSDGHWAEDVAQTVFSRLAAAKPPLKTDAELAGWLHRTTLHVSIDTWRRESRRRIREQQAAITDASPAPDPWAQIAPALDDALDELAESDREVLLLRYFERKSMRDVGNALGITEAAAKMRVGRALERLRDGLTARNAACGASALAALMFERSAEAVPTAVAARLAATQFVAAGATGSVIFSVLKQIIALMTRYKLAAILTASVLGLAVIATVSQTRLRQEASAAPAVEPKTNLTRANLVRRAPGAAVSNAATASANAASDLASLEDELRALLYYPSPSSSYPPPELRRVLDRFGTNWLAAVRILREHLDVNDNETRYWSLSGINNIIGVKTFQKSPSGSADPKDIMAAREMVDPKVREIFCSDDVPPNQRITAYLTLEHPLPGMGPDANTEPRLSTETWDAIAAVLSSPDKGSLDFRFELLTFLSRGRAGKTSISTLAEHLKTILNPLLDNGTDEQQLLAAFELASLPGEKPESVKATLLREMACRDPFHRNYKSYAAQALGRLGPDAADAVPALLAWARESNLPDSGFEAACRIQPDLRAQYPQIDAKLKEEERQAAEPDPSKRITPTAPRLADSRMRAVLLLSKTIEIQTADDPAAAKEGAIKTYESEAQTAAPSDKSNILAFIKELQQVPIEEPKDSVPAISMRGVVIEAGTAMNETRHFTNGKKVMELILRWNKYFQAHPEEDKISVERMTSFSQGLKGLDPEVEADWRKHVLRNQPNADRFMPAQ